MLPQAYYPSPYSFAPYVPNDQSQQPCHRPYWILEGYHQVSGHHFVAHPHSYQNQQQTSFCMERMRMEQNFVASCPPSLSQYPAHIELNRHAPPFYPQEVVHHPVRPLPTQGFFTYSLSPHFIQPFAQEIPILRNSQEPLFGVPSRYHEQFSSFNASRTEVVQQKESQEQPLEYRFLELPARKEQDLAAATLPLDIYGASIQDEETSNMQRLADELLANLEKD